MLTTLATQAYVLAAQILAADPTPTPDPKAGDGNSIGDWIPTFPDFVLLKPFHGLYKTFAGTGMAIMVIGGFLGAIIGFSRMAFAGSNAGKTKEGAGQARTGMIVFAAGLIIGVLFIAIASAAQLAAKS